jgi:hypothetical protein
MLLQIVREQYHNCHNVQDRQQVARAAWQINRTPQHPVPICVHKVRFTTPQRLLQGT